MRCHEINELLSAYLDGLLAPSVQNTVKLHLEGCAACRSEFEDLAMVVSMVKNLPLVEPPVEFGKELRLKLENLKSPPGKIKRLIPGRWTTVVALAASFLLVFGIAGAWPELSSRLLVSNQEAGVQTQIAGRTSASAVTFLDKYSPEVRDESINREKTLSVNNDSAEKYKEVVQEEKLAAKPPASSPSEPGSSQSPEIAAVPLRAVDSGAGDVAARGAVPGVHLFMASSAGPAERALLSIKADNTEAAMRQISDVARLNGGSVEVSREMDGREMTVTIPDSQFDKVMAEIGKAGKVTINNSSAPEDIKKDVAATPTVTGVYGKNGAEPGTAAHKVTEADSGKQLAGDKAVPEKPPVPADAKGVSIIRIKFE